MKKQPGYQVIRIDIYLLYNLDIVANATRKEETTEKCHRRANIRL